MIRKATLLSLALALLVAAPAFSGGDHKKCSYNTQDCLNYMATKFNSNGWVGVEIDMDEESNTLTVTRVIPGSPAEAAGMESGDKWLAVNGVRFSEDNEKALKKAKKDWKPGQSVNYTIQRNGTDREVTLTLAPMPADVLAKWIGQHMLEHASTGIAQK